MTLTVSANTPDEIGPQDFHAGMYSKGKIVKVENYDVNNIDVTNNSGALQVKGTAFLLADHSKEHLDLLIKFTYKNKKTLQIMSILFMNIQT